MKIKPTFELQNHPGIFAVGDIIDWPEQKQAGKVMAHAEIAVANLMSFLEGKPLAKVYKGADGNSSTSVRARSPVGARGRRENRSPATRRHARWGADPRF